MKKRVFPFKNLSDFVVNSTSTLHKQLISKKTFPSYGITFDK